MSDYILSIIRTLVPVGVGSLLGLLAHHGLSISDYDSANLTAGLVALAIGAYYMLARAAEQSRQPWLAALGRLLLGGVKKAPHYLPTAAKAKTDDS